MKNQHKAYLISRMAALGFLGIILTYGILYIPGMWETIAMAMALVIVPMMLFVSMGIVDAGTFQALEAISKYSMKDVKEALKPAAG